jgi:hypothetical protein
MKLITKRSKILEVSSLWDRQYVGRSKIYQDKIDIGNRLRKLDLNTVSAKEVDDIIGNGSWTYIRCHECEKSVERAVELGQEPDYESSTANVCFMCLQKATLLITDLLK